MRLNKFKLIFVMVLAVGLLSIGVSGAELGTKKNPVQWLFPPSTNATVVQDIGRQVAADIHEMTGIYIKPTVTADYAALVEAVKAAEGDTMATPTTDQYARIYMETDGNVHPRLAAVRYGTSYYFSTVYALRDEMDYHPDLEGVLDAVEGKTWIYNDRGSTSGYVLPNMVFDGQDVELAGKVKSGGHTASIVALLEGQGDFATSYGSPPEPPKGVYTEWEFGDDPEMWIYNHYLKELLPKKFRGQVKDVRQAVGETGMYNYEEVIEKVGIVGTFGPIPNDSVVFTNDFPKDLEDEIVNAIIKHIRSEEGSELWGDPNFYEWTDLEKITDDYYDSYRRMVGYPVPED